MKNLLQQQGIVCFGDEPETPETSTTQYNWTGKKVKKYVKSTVFWCGKQITNSKQECPECSASINLNREITLNGGKHLAEVLLCMNEHGKVREEYNNFVGLAESLDLFEFYLQFEIITNKYDKIRHDFHALHGTHTARAQIICSKCNLPLGTAQIDLEIILPKSDLEVYTWDKLYRKTKNMESRIKAKVAKILGHKNWNALMEWAEADLSKLPEIVNNFKTELRTLKIPEDLVYSTQKSLDQLDFSHEIIRRKMSVCQVVEKLAKMEAVGR